MLHLSNTTSPRSLETYMVLRGPHTSNSNTQFKSFDLFWQGLGHQAYSSVLKMFLFVGSLRCLPPDSTKQFQAMKIPRLAWSLPPVSSTQQFHTVKTSSTHLFSAACHSMRNSHLRLLLCGAKGRRWYFWCPLPLPFWVKGPRRWLSLLRGSKLFPPPESPPRPVPLPPKSLAALCRSAADLHHHGRGKRLAILAL